MIDTTGYEKHFSEESFWETIKKYSKKIGKDLLENVLILWYAIPEASPTDKAIIIAALGYFICPIDVIPDITPIVGYSDDFGVVAFVVAKIRLSCSQAVIDKAQAKVKEWFD